MATFYNELTNAQQWLYRLVVRFMLKTNNIGRIANDSDCHAVVLISELINNAHKKVDIYCKCLANSVWGTEVVLSAITAAIERGVRFHVAVQSEKDDCADSRAYRLFVDKCVHIKHCSDKKAGIEAPIKANFLLVDEKSFRFEPNPEEHKGFAYVCNDEMAKKLKDAFYGKIWTKHS